jgi:hypothetical protein
MHDLPCQNSPYSDIHELAELDPRSNELSSNR